MLVLILIIFVLMSISPKLISSLNEPRFEWIPLIGITGAIITTLFLIIAIGDFDKYMFVDERIDLYTTENEKIERRISETVENYMNYKGEVLKKISPEESMTLVSIYPDLKSDQLVKAQIETYQENEKKLIELKEAKIKEPIYKWWLYFGKAKKGRKYAE